MNDTNVQADARTLLADDRFAQSLGIALIESDAGWHLELAVTESHCNFLGGLHGAVLFGLADTAMALVSNAERGVAVAVDASVSFARGVRPGDVISAIVEPVRETRRLGWYDIRIINQEREPVGAFRGTIYRPTTH